MKEKLFSLLTKLGLLDKAKAGSLTAQEWKTISESYKAEYKSELAQDMVQANSLSPAQITELQGIIASVPDAVVTEPAAAATVEGAASATEGTQKENHEKSDKPVIAESLFSDLSVSIKSLVDSNKILKTQLETLKPQAMNDIPEGTAGMKLALSGPGTTDKFLFGIQHPIFSMDRRWNKIANQPSYAAANQLDEDKDGPEFRSAFNGYTASVKNRFRQLAASKMLDPVKLSATTFTTDMSGLSAAGLGDQYMIRRQDALIARILQLRSVNQYFPTQYGVQDRIMMTNAYFTDVSQAYQVGKVWKGGMSLEPEFGYVDDAMTKVFFGPLKEIERTYLAYLNSDGSDPIKWSMIEYALLGVYTKMQMEQNKRHILGLYVKPEDGKAGHFLNAGTGVIYTLVRLYHEFKMKLHEDSAYRTYDKSTFLASVKEFISDAQESLDEDQEMDGKSVYLNSQHKSWWMENIRSTYGKDIDFTGPSSYLYNVPDTSVPIIWLPNLGNLTIMFLQAPGNIEFLENIPGEMLSMKMKDDMEAVYGWSTWKEGCDPVYVGKRFSSKAELDSNNYSLQQIFMNKPAISLAADATAADAVNQFWFLTIANTKATALTDISNAKAGRAYIIECNSLTNATTLSKAAKFATISANFVPTAVGDYIMVILNSDGTSFLELERAVGGVRTVNKDLQPNVPGAR